MNTTSFLPFFLELMMKSAATLLLAALILRVWKRATAAQRHFVWFAAIATLLILPATRLVVPRWTLPIEPVAKVRVPMTLSPIAPVVIEESVSTERIAAPRRAKWRLPDWRAALIGTWLGGVMILLGYRVLGSWRLRSLKKTSAPLEDTRVRSMASAIFSELRITRVVDLRISSTCCVPMTWGARRPVLILPCEALAWSDSRLQAALRHEAGHISRQDYLVRGIAQIACALYWPNPLVWFAARVLRIAQEQATDDLVLCAGTPAEDYAAQLFDSAKVVAARGLFARHAVAMASPSTLEDRVLAIVDERRDRRPLGRFTAMMGIVAVACMLAVCTAAQLQGADRASATPENPDKAGKASPLQIEIETKFVEINTDDARVPEILTDTAPGAIQGVFSDPQFQVIIRALNQKKGVDLLSAPRVTTKSKQRAVIEIVREFRSPEDWERDPEGGWKPREFESKQVGVTMEVTPEINADGSIALSLKPSVVEFLGFVDLDTGKIASAPEKAYKPGALPDLTNVRPTQRLKAIFSERKVEASATLQNGYTVALTGIPETAKVDPFEKAEPKRKLIVFVSARIIQPRGAQHEPAPSSAGNSGNQPPTRNAPGAEASAALARADTFLRAYMSYRKAEDFEREGKIEQALAENRRCLEALDEVTKLAPAWNPQVVAYRKRRALEMDGRLRGK